MGCVLLNTPTYTDIKIRNDIEMTNNKRYFQPKEWNLNKLLYNYNCLWHIGHKEQKYFEKFIAYFKCTHSTFIQRAIRLILNKEQLNQMENFMKLKKISDICH